MSQSDVPEVRCSECGEKIVVDSGDVLKTVDVPYFVIDQLERQHPELADELLRNDGTLALHEQCTHEVEEWLEPAMVPIQEAEEYDTDIKKECPVCGLSIYGEASGCGRCGHSFEEETLVEG